MCRVCVFRKRFFFLFFFKNISKRFVPPKKLSLFSIYWQTKHILSSPPLAGNSKRVGTTRRRHMIINTKEEEEEEEMNAYRLRWPWWAPQREGRPLPEPSAALSASIGILWKRQPTKISTDKKKIIIIIIHFNDKSVTIIHSKKKNYIHIKSLRCWLIPSHKSAAMRASSSTKNTKS